MSAEPTGRVGDYEIVGVLGRGGMGNVFKVRNVISDRIDAMKVLLPNLAGRQELVQRFQREIKVLASLDHPNIAALRTALSWENRLVMIMEYVEGVTLAECLEQGPFSLSEALNHTQQILGALAYAHSRHIIHRDIKPGNMMLSRRTVKLMDFGIARCENDASLTATGSTLGSLYYMSPEQVKGEPADERSDLYSLGISLYEMVTGKRPFEEDNDYSIMAAHLRKQPTPPSALRPELPGGLSEIILRAMAKDPEKRFQSADQLCNALKNLGASLSSPATKNAATTLVDCMGEALLGALTPPNLSPDGMKPASEPARAPSNLRPQAASSVPAEIQLAVHSPSSPAVRAQSPLLTQSLESTAPISTRHTPHRGLYISLGALLVMLMLVGAGLYFPRRTTTHAANNAGPVEPPSTAYKPGFGDTRPPVSTVPTSSVAQPSFDHGSPAVPQSVATQPHVPNAKYPKATRGTPTLLGAGDSRSRTAASRSERSILKNSGLTEKVQPEAHGALHYTPSSPASVPAAADLGQLEQLAHDLDLLSSRADAVNNSLTTLRDAQRAQGLGLRGDIASSHERMQRYLARAQSSLRGQDASDAKKYLELAETEVADLEKYLGR